MFLNITAPFENFARAGIRVVKEIAQAFKIRSVEANGIWPQTGGDNRSPAPTALALVSGIWVPSVRRQAGKVLREE